MKPPNVRLGRQTRPHGDLDIVIEEEQLASLVGALGDRGYRPVPRDDTRDWNFVLGDDEGHEIDFHVIVIGADGRGRYGPPELGEFWNEAEALAWTGEIGGRRSPACRPIGSFAGTRATSSMPTTSQTCPPSADSSASRSRTTTSHFALH